jgi:hypothetical protein
MRDRSGKPGQMVFASEHFALDAEPGVGPAFENALESQHVADHVGVLDVPGSFAGGFVGADRQEHVRGQLVMLFCVVRFHLEDAVPVEPERRAAENVMPEHLRLGQQRIPAEQAAERMADVHLARHVDAILARDQREDVAFDVIAISGCLAVDAVAIVAAAGGRGFAGGERIAGRVIARLLDIDASPMP